MIGLATYYMLYSCVSVMLGLIWVVAAAVRAIRAKAEARTYEHCGDLEYSPPRVDWLKVRALERDIFGVTYFRLDGTYVPEGISPWNIVPGHSSELPQGVSDLIVKDLSDMPMAEYAELRQEWFLANLSRGKAILSIDNRDGSNNGARTEEAIPHVSHRGVIYLEAVPYREGSGVHD